MHPYVIALFAILAAAVPLQAPDTKATAIALDRDPIALGQTATLHWYFTGTKVTLSGGKFGAGTDVTGKTSISDRPLKTTRYNFDVSFLTAQATAIPAPAIAVKPLKAHYSTVVEVVDPKTMGLQPYYDAHGWSVMPAKAWQRDNATVSDSSLIFFQPEDDAVDRLAVSVMPFAESSCSTLMDKVMADVPSHYSAPQIVSRSDITHEGIPATLVVFTGGDNTHDDLPTESVILALVKDGHAYIVSARTAARNYAARAKALNFMVRSFSFQPRPAATASKG